VSDWAKDHKTMVMLGVDTESALKRWMSLLELNGLKFSAFIEPDIGDQITAIAVLPSDGSLFKRLPLLS
jgi:hypothetical protein